MSENIIKFDLKVKDQKHGIKRGKTYNPCRHKQMLADEHLQQLECADCGKIISPWEYILKICKKEQSLFDHIKYATMERDRIDESLVNVKRKVKNAKSQLSRALHSGSK